MPRLDTTRPAVIEAFNLEHDPFPEDPLDLCEECWDLWQAEGLSADVLIDHPPYAGCNWRCAECAIRMRGEE